MAQAFDIFHVIVKRGVMLTKTSEYETKMIIIIMCICTERVLIYLMTYGERESNVIFYHYSLFLIYDSVKNRLSANMNQN